MRYLYCVLWLWFPFLLFVYYLPLFLCRLWTVHFHVSILVCWSFAFVFIHMHSWTLEISGFWKANYLRANHKRVKWIETWWCFVKQTIYHLTFLPIVPFWRRSRIHCDFQNHHWTQRTWNEEEAEVLIQIELLGVRKKFHRPMSFYHRSMIKVTIQVLKMSTVLVVRRLLLIDYYVHDLIYYYFYDLILTPKWHGRQINFNWCTLICILRCFDVHLMSIWCLISTRQGNLITQNVSAGGGKGKVIVNWFCARCYFDVDSTRQNYTFNFHRTINMVCVIAFYNAHLMSNWCSTDAKRMYKVCQR